MVLTLLIAALIAAVMAAAFAPVVIMAGVIDVPNRPRKIHKEPTPTSGGVAIGFGFALALAVSLFWPGGPWQNVLDADLATQFGFAVAFSLAALLLGLWDDLRPLDAYWKSGLMVALSIGVTIFVARADFLPIAGSYTLQLSAGFAIVGSAAWIFVLMNSTNFMDGLDGLSMGSTAISLAALAIVAAINHGYASALMAVAGAGALIGFLFWNWPRGRLFAGDAGALFAGMLAAMAALMTVHETGVSPFVMPILFFPALADALLTLVWRVQQRRNLFDGHREHFYQIALRGGIDPRQITLWYWLATLGCCALGIAAHVIRRQVVPVLETMAGPEPSLASAAVFVVGLIVKVSLVALIVAATWISIRVRQFQVEHALDGE